MQHPDKHHSPGATPRKRGWRSPLRREIALALALKLALLIGIKMMFFSQPVSKQEAAARIGVMIDGGSAAAASGSPSPHTDGTEQK